MIHLLLSLIPLVVTTPPAGPFEFVAFGDWGGRGDTAQESVEKINKYIGSTSIDTVFLLGDNFYPHGIDPLLGVADPRFDLFAEHLAKGLDRVQFYTVLGNHDLKNGEASWRAQLEYSFVRPNWILPDRSHFQRFMDGGVCVWFIDTSEGIVAEETMGWLESTLSTESSSCLWKFFATHFPLVTKGTHRSSRQVLRLRTQLTRLINRYSIDLYISGHDHNTQLLRDPKIPGCQFILVGAVCDLVKSSLTPHPTRVHYGDLVWGDDMIQPVVVRVSVTPDRVHYQFVQVKSQKHGNDRSIVLYEGVVEK
jgi:tartrate-resistant acid phosphatase type 5